MAIFKPPATPLKHGALPYCTTYQAARILGVSTTTIQIWADRGMLDFWKTPGGHRRIPLEAVNALLESQDPAKNGRSAEQRPLRILVIEDEPSLLVLYRQKLERPPLAPQLFSASNGIQAMGLASKIVPDLLITDLKIPAGDGFQLIRSIRATPELAHIEIVVVTGLDPLAVAESGFLPAGIPVLPKPIPFAEIERIASDLAHSLGLLPARDMRAQGDTGPFAPDGEQYAVGRK